MSITRRGFIKSSGLAVAASPLLGMPAIAQTPEVTLRLQHFLPAQSHQHRDWFLPWAEKVAKDSNGRIKVDVYPSMQLGGRPPQLFDQAKDGVVDIVWTLTGNNPGRFPRLEVFELPFIASGLAEQSSQSVWDFAQKYAQNELKDVKTLAAFTHGKANIYSKDRAIKTTQDMKGLKIRVPSRPINDVFQLMEASPQAIPAPGVPEALAKGVVDAVVMPYEIVPSLKLDELTNNISVFDGNRSLYTVVFLFVMNKTRYGALADDLKKVIDDNSGATLSRFVGAKFDSWDLIGKAAADKANMKMTNIGGADLEGWKKVSRPVIDAWIATRTKAGDNGAELYQAAEALTAKYAP